MFGSGREVKEMRFFETKEFNVLRKKLDMNEFRISRNVN